MTDRNADTGLDPDAAAAAPPVRDTGSLTARTFELLRADIISGEIAPGSKLKIEDLRQRYDVGGSPVREALSLLTSYRLVERLDQRGFRAARISLDEFDELLDTRCWIEERALRETIAKADAGWEEEVVVATYRLSRARRAPVAARAFLSDEWEILHKRFHMALVSRSGSRYLFDLCDQLYDQNIRYRQAARGDSDQPVRDVTREHQAIADAAIARDADAAVTCLLAHYRNTGEFLRSRLQSRLR